MARRLLVPAFFCLVCVATAAAQKGTAPSVPRSSGGGGGTSGMSSGSGSGSRTAGSTPYNPYGNSPYGNASLFGDTSEADQRAENLRWKAREAERQKRMVEDAKRLVDLAARYRANVSEHGTPTVEDNRLLAEMEKLARSVKDRMRGM